MSDQLTKRVCVDDGRPTSIQQTAQSSTLEPTDLADQLRAVGSRIRKSVTEGYTTPSSSRVFAKAQSTTTIFASARDINSQIFGRKSESQPPVIPTVSARKRSHSVSDQTNQITATQENPDEFEMEVDKGTTELTDVCTSFDPQDKDKRRIKPLRKSRKLMETQSLPVGALRFSNHSDDPYHTLSSNAESDDEWGMQPLTNDAFQPIVL